MCVRLFGCFFACVLFCFYFKLMSLIFSVVLVCVLILEVLNFVLELVAFIILFSSSNTVSLVSFNCFRFLSFFPFPFSLFFLAFHITFHITFFNFYLPSFLYFLFSSIIPQILRSSKINISVVKIISRIYHFLDIAFLTALRFLVLLFVSFLRTQRHGRVETSHAPLHGCLVSSGGAALSSERVAEQRSLASG